MSERDVEMADEADEADDAGEGWGEDGDGDGDGDGWDEDGDDAAGWDDYGEEEEDEVVKQALEQTRKKKELEEKVEEVLITFRPQRYREGMIARISGDFTEWIPVTMRMHPYREMEQDPSKVGLFFAQLKLAKGFLYRYVFEVDNVE